MAITLMENFRAIFYAPFYAAFSLGAYVAEGVDVEVRPSSDPDETAKALLTGGGDVVWGGPMRVQVAGDSNPDCGLVSFCEVVERDPFFIVGRGPVPEGGLKRYYGEKNSHGVRGSHTMDVSSGRPTPGRPKSRYPEPNSGSFAWERMLMP